MRVSVWGANWCNESDQADLPVAIDGSIIRCLFSVGRVTAAGKLRFSITHTHVMCTATRFVQPPDASGEAKGRRTDEQ